MRLLLHSGLLGHRAFVMVADLSWAYLHMLFYDLSLGPSAAVSRGSFHMTSQLLEAASQKYSVQLWTIYDNQCLIS